MDSATVFSPEAHTVTAVKSKVPTLKWTVNAVKSKVPTVDSAATVRAERFHSSLCVFIQKGTKVNVPSLVDQVTSLFSAW